MRLEVTAKCLLKKRKIRAILFITGFIVFFALTGKSQTYKVTFKENTVLSEALLQSSKIYGFKVAFDAQRLGNVHVNKTITGGTTDEFIANLLENSGFTYIYKHGSYLIVENTTVQAPVVSECQLIGSVTDFETGEQLPYASVLIQSQNILTSTSTNGTFSVKNIVSNPVHINISYIGYYDLDTVIRWSNSIAYPSFKLRHKLNVIDSVSIKGKKVEMVECRSDLDFSTTINPSKLIDLPATTEPDIIKTLQLLPGISYSENSAELSIRGGTSDQNLVLFDGQTLYNLSHYYGVFSAINPNIVKDIQVFKGGFDSRYGERIAGIVDITGKSGNQMKPAVVADFNLLSANISVELPITKKLTIIAAGRRSYSDIYLTSFAKEFFVKKSPIIQNEQNQLISISEPEYHFYDFNTKLNYRVSNNENLSVSLYGGKDFFRNAYNAMSPSIYVANVDTNIIYNYGASANWQKQWNSSFYSALLVGTSGYINKSGNLTYIENLVQGGQTQRFLPDSQNVFQIRNRNDLKDYFVSQQNTITVNNFNQVNFGILYRYNTIYYHKDADNIYIYDNTNQTSWLTSAYLQDKITLFSNFTIKPGLRINYYAANRKIYLEPRFAANYNFSDNFSVRMAAGIYDQFIAQVSATQETGYSKSFWVLANDSLNPVIKANHLIFGLSYNLKNILFDAEAYYKQYSGIQEYLFLSQFNRSTEFNKYFTRDRNILPNQPPQQPSYFITGSGETYGIDFFVRYKAHYFTSLLSYTLSKSTLQFAQINSGSKIPALTDQTHQISFSNLFNINKWNIGTIALFSTGRPYISSTSSDRIVPITRTYNRLPNFFRFDLSANYNFYIKSVRFKTGFSLINLFNTQNYFDANTRTFDFENSTFNEINLIESQKLSYNLFFQISF